MSEEDDVTSLLLKIEGFVQAVGFRQFAIAEARRLKLDGWVRNSFDGSVEALVSGPTKDVEAFVGHCIRGPAGSRVTNVDLKRAEPPEVKGFNRAPST